MERNKDAGLFMKKIIIFILAILVIGTNIYVRIFPAYLPRLHDKADFDMKAEVIKYFENRLYKNCPQYTRFVQKKLARDIAKKEVFNSVSFRNKVKSEYERLKDQYQDPSKQTYLIESDGYGWARLTRLLYENGYPGTEYLKKRMYDTFTDAPYGIFVLNHRFLFYISLYLYKLFLLASQKITLQTFLFYVPLFYALIFFITLFLFCRRFFFR